MLTCSDVSINGLARVMPFHTFSPIDIAIWFIYTTNRNPSGGRIRSLLASTSGSACLYIFQRWRKSGRGRFGIGLDYCILRLRSSEHVPRPLLLRPGGAVQLPWRGAVTVCNQRKGRTTAAARVRRATINERVFMSIPLSLLDTLKWLS